MAVLIAILCGASFYYAYSKKVPYSNEKITNSSRLCDYSILISCISFLTLEGYLQYQYKIFGDHYGIISFIPSVLFLVLAYYFDHLGVLSIGLTCLTTWAGLAINPMDLLQTFSNDRMVTNVSLCLGVFLIITSTILEKKNIKKHFTFTNYNFAAMTLLLYSLSGVMNDEFKLIYFLILIASTLFFIHYAKKEKSKYFFAVSILTLFAGCYFYFFKNH